MRDNRSVLMPVVLTVVAVTATISASIFAFRYFERHSDVFRLISGLRQNRNNGVYEVTMAAKDLPVPRQPPETIPFTQMVRLREMLTSGRFDELNGVLEGYQQDFERDPLNEYKLSDAYQSFTVTDPGYEASFMKWIDHSPDAYQPYLALAQYYYSRGLASRGEGTARETSEEQFGGMRHYFSEASSNIDRAQAIHPDLMIAYQMLIGMVNCGGDHEREDRVINKAMKLFPSSSLILFSALWSKQPRWGGSYTQMERLVKKAEAHVGANPYLATLYGLIYYDQADILRRAKKYQEAMACLGKALSFGDLWIIYETRARICCFDLKDYDSALEAINRSIELRPTKESGYCLRAIIYLGKERYDVAKADLETAALIKPGDAEVRQRTAQAADILVYYGHKRFKTDLEGAIREYNRALEINPENVEARFWRGRAFYGLKEFKAALADFQSAIKIDPHHFESYRMIDYTLARSRQWDTIVDYWNTYIALEPGNAQAYLERSGTHYNNRDFKKAMADLKKACDLGLQEACDRYAKWSSRS